MTSQGGTWPLVYFKTFPSSLDDLGSPVPPKMFDLFSLSDTKDIRTPGNTATMMWDLIWCEIIPKPCLIPRRRKTSDRLQEHRPQGMICCMLSAPCNREESLKERPRRVVISQKRGDASVYTHCVTTVTLLQTCLPSPSSLEEEDAARSLQEAAGWLRSPKHRPGEA